jgi:hypothetical protein
MHTTEVTAKIARGTRQTYGSPSLWRWVVRWPRVISQHGMCPPPVPRWVRKSATAATLRACTCSSLHPPSHTLHGMCAAAHGAHAPTKGCDEGRSHPFSVCLVRSLPGSVNAGTATNHLHTHRMLHLDVCQFRGRNARTAQGPCTPGKCRRTRGRRHCV